MSTTLITDLLDVLDKLSGGVHPGFRPVHAKGVMYSGHVHPLARRGETDAGAARRSARPPRSPCGSRCRRGFRPSPTTTRRGPARRGWRCGSTWPTTSTPTSSPTRITGSRPGPGRSSWSSSGRRPRAGRVPPPRRPSWRSWPPTRRRRRSSRPRSRSRRASPGRRTSPSPRSSSRTRTARAGSAGSASAPKPGPSS